MANTDFVYDILGPRDLQVGLTDHKKDDKYCISIGRILGIKIFGTLEELTQIFAMGEALLENERIRKRMPAGFEEEKRRAEER